MNMTDKGTLFFSSLKKSSMGNPKRKDHPGGDKGFPENAKDTLSKSVRSFPTLIKEWLILQRPQLTTFILGIL